MFAKEREQTIVDMIARHGSVTVSELTLLFQVSIETVRKDLLKLEREGLLERVHGGAVAVNRLRGYLPLPVRMQERVDSKSRLCQVAAGVVQEHDTIMLDTGATANEIANLLCRNFHSLTVITHSFGLFHKLHTAGFRVIMIGGEYLEKEDCCYGPLAVSAFKALHANKCFIFPTSVSMKHGIGGTIPELMELQRAMMHTADQTYVLADSSKFESTSLMKLCDMQPNHIYITDDGLDEKICQLYRLNQIQLLRTPEDLLQ